MKTFTESVQENITKGDIYADVRCRCKIQNTVGSKIIRSPFGFLHCIAKKLVKA